MKTNQTKPTDALPASDEVVDWLRAQRALYAKLESMASGQRDLITGDQPTMLLGLLADRQRITNDLTDLAHRLEPVWRDWKRQRLRLSELQRREAESILEDIRTKMRKVMDRDEEDARLLLARKQAIGHSMKSTHSSAEAISAYRAASAPSLRLDHVEGAP
ncbi:MAG: hypothetical protein ACE5E5_03700 [Phycisphaerae bacterium]